MRKHLANVSPWILAAAFALLAVIVATFAVNNYNREKELMTEALLQKGIGVIRFLKTGVRVSMRAHRQGSGATDVSWVSHVQGVIDQLQDQEDIHFVELIDQKGRIIAASDPDFVNMVVGDEVSAFLQASGRREPVYRIHQSPDGEYGFQVAQSFPRLSGRMPPPFGQMRGRRMGHMGSRGRQGFSSPTEPEGRLDGDDVFLLVELDLASFNQAVRQQVLQLAVLSIVLLLVGAGGWLSLLTLQGYKGTQSRLRQIRAFNDLLVETLPLGLIATTSDDKIQVVNEAAERIAGVPASRLVGRRPLEVLPEPLAQSFCRSETAGGIPRSDETVMLSSDGRPRTLLRTMVTVRNEQGMVTGDVLLLQDVSNIRDLEAQLRRSERLAALGRMAAGVAHELRNPLSSIKGLALVLKGRTDHDGRETADVLVQEVERLNRSISELLDYARPEKLEKRETGVHNLVEKALTLVGVDAAGMNIRLETQLVAESDVVVVDEDRINQVLLNLLLNGLQAMPEGGELRIVTRDEGRWLYVDIEDSGVGIPTENMARVFDPYFTTKNDGTGLGLSLSAKIVEDHGGEIALDSEVGRGTRVRVKLPRKII